MPKAAEVKRSLHLDECIPPGWQMIDSKFVAMYLRKDGKLILTIAATFKIISSSDSNTANNMGKPNRIKVGEKALAEQDEADDSEAQESTESSSVTPAQPMNTAHAAESLLRLSRSDLPDVLNSLK